MINMVLSFKLKGGNPSFGKSSGLSRATLVQTSAVLSRSSSTRFRLVDGQFRRSLTVLAGIRSPVIHTRGIIPQDSLAAAHDA
jgi:hypothetical protein